MPAAHVARGGGGVGSLEGGGVGSHLGSLSQGHSLSVRHCVLVLSGIALGLWTWKGEGTGRVNVCKWIYRPHIYPDCQGDRAAGLSHPEQGGCSWRLWWSEPTCTRPPQGSLSNCPHLSSCWSACQECPLVPPQSWSFQGLQDPSRGLSPPPSFLSVPWPAAYNLARRA